MRHIGSIRRKATWPLIAALALALTVGIAQAAVTTDKPDYAPGSTVTISGDNSDGAGYLAGETVHVDVSGPYEYTASCEGVADGDGAWSCQVTLRDDDSADGTYSYTATGQTSGVSQDGTFEDNGGGTPDNCQTAPQGAVHFTVRDGFSGQSGDLDPAKWSVAAQSRTAGYVITKICIRHPRSSFALGGSGGDANSPSGGPDGDRDGTSSHSIPITQDGNGNTGDATRYGIDYEPSDGYSDCYTVSGMGTTLVTVTSLSGTEDADCNDIRGANEVQLHVDIFTEEESRPAATSEVSTWIHLNGDHSTNHDGGSVPLGSTIHDKVTVTTDPATTIPAGSDLTVKFFTTGDCSGSSTDVSYDPSGGTTFTQDPASPQGPLGLGSYSYQAFFTSGDTSEVTNSQSLCETVSVAKGDTSVDTTILFADGSPITGNPTTGALVKDSATVNGQVNGFSLNGGATVTFTWFTNGNCSPTGTGAGSPSLSSNPVYSNVQGPLSDGSYSFQATYSGNSYYNGSTSPCEPLTIGSSITSFWYQINGTGTQYDCTSLNGGSNCGTVASSKQGSTAYDFLVHVDVTNNSGVTKDVKVQGGLAAKAKYYQSVPGTHAKGAQITLYPATLNDVSCGTAYLDLSNQSNVVTWIINNMAAGARCDLYVWVSKGYSSTGLQPVTSSWSQVDCGSGTVSNEAYTQSNRSALGDGKPGCLKSRYTGDLLVRVT